MRPMSGAIGRRPLVVFFILAVLIALAAMAIRSTDPAALGAALNDMMAKNLKADIFTAVEYSIKHPVLWNALLFPFAPTLAALIVIAVVYGRRGLGEWFGRLLPWRGISAREGVWVWLLFVLFFFAFVAVYFIIALSAGDTAGAARTVERFGATAPLAVLGLFVALLVSPGPLLEEMGWRGFALPVLLKTMSPLNASIVLGLMWAAWHLPREILPLMSGAEGVWFKFLVKQANFVPGCIAGSILATYVYMRLGGSVWGGILTHAWYNELSVNVFLSQDPLLTIGGANFRSLGLMQIAIALILVLLAGPRLGQRDGDTGVAWSTPNK